MKDIRTAERRKDGSLAKNSTIEDDQYNSDGQEIDGETVIFRISTTR